MGILASVDYHIILIGVKENPCLWTRKEMCNTPAAQDYMISDALQLASDVFEKHVRQFIKGEYMYITWKFSNVTL